MASDQRQCPRCKTWNARVRTNCSQCGAVMLGVAAIDIEAMARGESEPLPSSSGGGPGNDELRQTLEALQATRAERQAAGATQSGSGCLGCLGRLLLIVAILAGGAIVITIDSPESKPGRALRKLLHDIERDLRVESRRRAPQPYVPPPPPRPRPMSPPDPWNVPTQPAPQTPDATGAPVLAPDSNVVQPLNGRAKDVAKALDRRALLLVRCVQPDTRPGEARKITARITLRVHADSGGAVDFEDVVEPGDAPTGALRCLRSAARGLVVLNGDPVTFVYRWPKGSER